MLRLLIPVLLLALGTAGGVGAGLFLMPETDAAAESGADDHGEDHNTDAEGDDHGVDGTPEAGSDTEFVRLNNQFIVPIVHRGSVRSLVVMALTLEVDTGTTEAVFRQEPRLRDAFLQVMFAHANIGGFDGSFTDAHAMAPLREGLLEAARRSLGDRARDVLIVDITRQDA